MSIFYKGGTALNSDRQGTAEEFVLVGALASADSAGGIISLANPFGEEIVVTDVFIDVTTAASGSCTVDVGIAADGTTLNDTLLDGINPGAGGASRIFNLVKDSGTNGVGASAWATNKFFTASKASGAASGLVGRYTIKGFKRA